MSGGDISNQKKIASWKVSGVWVWRNNWNLDFGGRHSKFRNDGTQAMVKHPFCDFLSSERVISVLNWWWLTSRKDQPELGWRTKEMDLFRLFLHVEFSVL